MIQIVWSRLIVDCALSVGQLGNLMHNKTWVAEGCTLGSTIKPGSVLNICGKTCHSYPLHIKVLFPKGAPDGHKTFITNSRATVLELKQLITKHCDISSGHMQLSSGRQKILNTDARALIDYGLQDGCEVAS